MLELPRQLQHSNGIEAPPMASVLVLPTAAVLELLVLPTAAVLELLELEAAVLEPVLELVAAGAGSYRR